MKLSFGTTGSELYGGNIFQMELGCGKGDEPRDAVQRMNGTTGSEGQERRAEQDQQQPEKHSMTVETHEDLSLNSLKLPQPCPQS